MKEANLEHKILGLLNKTPMSVSQFTDNLSTRNKVETNIERPIRTIGIISGKGGVGKTVTTINLTSALMSFGKSAIAIDADLKMSCLGLQLGMYYFPVTLNDVLKNKSDILNAIYIHSSGVRIIPASLSIDTVDLSKLQQTLHTKYFENSLLLIDSPPGLETNTRQVLKACNEVIIVTLPEIPSITDVIKMIDVCKEVGVKPIGIIVNRYRKNEPGQITFKEIENICELPVLGVIPEDKNIRKSLHREMPVILFNPYSSSSIAYKKIAARLLGFDYNPPALSSIKKLFWGLKK